MINKLTQSKIILTPQQDRQAKPSKEGHFISTLWKWAGLPVILTSLKVLSPEAELAHE